MLKVSIGRRQEQDFFIRLTDVFHQLIKGRNDPIGHDQLLPVKMEIIVPLTPGGKCVVIPFFKYPGITEDLMLQPLPDPVDHHIRGRKFHICYPHADKLFILIRKSHRLIRMKNIVPESICVQRIGMSPVDHFIKIVHLIILLFFCFLLHYDSRTAFGLWDHTVIVSKGGFQCKQPHFSCQ